MLYRAGDYRRSFVFVLQLHARDDDLVGNLAVVFGEVDDKVTSQLSAISIRLTNNLHHGRFAVPPVHPSS